MKQDEKINIILKIAGELALEQYNRKLSELPNLIQRKILINAEEIYGNND